MPAIITVTNQKGGVGKTTTAASLAAGLSAKHRKVLCIDLDPQGNLGFCLGLESGDYHTIYEVLTRKITIRKAIQRTRYCDIICSDILLSGLEVALSGTAGREFMLKQALSELLPDEYDYIIIDTPPSLSILTVNAFVASNYLIIPITPEILSLMGVAQLAESIVSIRSSLNPSLQMLGILLTKFNKQTRLAREVEELACDITAQLNTVVFKTRIRNGVTAAEAPAHGECIQDYAPRSAPAIDYAAFVDEVCEKLENR